jgi:hypothetical protein
MRTINRRISKSHPLDFDPIERHEEKRSNGRFVAPSGSSCRGWNSELIKSWRDGHPSPSSEGGEDFQLDQSPIRRVRTAADGELRGDLSKGEVSLLTRDESNRATRKPRKRDVGPRS